jgi:branched-chain amino acid transport system substrate-binding protein
MSRGLWCCQRSVLPLIVLLVVVFILQLWARGEATEFVKVGLVAALSGISAKSGEGIVRSLTIAMDEINARGGVARRRIQPTEGPDRNA